MLTVDNNNNLMGCCLSKKTVAGKDGQVRNRHSNLDEMSANILELKSGYPRLTDFYTLKKVIGQGAFGIVRKGARIDNPNITVAIKCINKSKIKDSLDLLKNEVEILSKMDHPNIVKLYEYFNEEYFFNIVTEFCSGGELFDRIIQNGRISESDVMRYMKKMMRAINHLHKLNICHRDVKPQNFIFENETQEAELKLIDFGLAHRFHLKKRHTVTMDTFAGTSYYMAPEVIQGPYDSKCDV